MGNFGKLNFSVSFNRTSAFPIEANSYFESLAAAQEAAATAVAVGSAESTYYIGQTLTVVENGASKSYIIQPDKTLGDYVTTEQLASKQDILVSGTNIKTLNGESLLGSGDIQIQGGGVGKADTNSGGTGEIFNYYDRNKATGVFSHSEGYITTASGSRSHAEGSDTIASGFKSHAEGYDTIADGEASHAEGYDTKAEYIGSHSEGQYTLASGRGAHAEGCNTIAKNEASHAEGHNTIALNSGHSEGCYTLALGYYSHAEGLGDVQKIVCKVTEAIDDYIIIDRILLTSSFNGYFLIYPNIIDIYLITNVEYPTNNTTKITYKTTTSSGNKVEVRDYYRTFIFCRYGITVGDYSHSEGQDTRALGKSSHAEGVHTTASADYSHAEGGSSIAYGVYSHAEGSSITHGGHSHAEGQDTIANGEDSHSEGNYTRADGDYSHSQGIDTNAIGSASHAEGKGSIAYGEQSHAAGFQSIATGNYAFALGGSGLKMNTTDLEAFRELDTSQKMNYYKDAYSTYDDSYHIANGKGSLVTGKNNLAIGNYSSAHGEGNIAIDDHQFVVGKFCNPVYATVFCVGYGADNANRENYFYVMTNGNTWIKGQIMQNSDVRLKDNITTLQPQGSLRLVEFDWKNGNGHSYGFIADEVEKIYPDMVTVNSEGYKSLNYNAALCAKIAELEKRVESLEQQLNSKTISL